MHILGMPLFCLNSLISLLELEEMVQLWEKGKKTIIEMD